MALRHRLEYLSKEHCGLLNLAAKIEKLLELASEDDYAGRLRSLIGLRSFGENFFQPRENGKQRGVYCPASMDGENS